jgi:hypothetical protein
VSTGGDTPDRQPGLTLEDLPDSLNLGLQSSPLTSGKPGERLDGYVNPSTGASLVPDASDHAIDEQDWVVAGLARRGESARGRLSREEPVPRVASDDVRVEVGQQQDGSRSVLCTGQLRIPAKHQCGRAIERDISELPIVSLELGGRPPWRSTDPLSKLLRCSRPVCVQVAGDYIANCLVYRCWPESREPAVRMV